MYLGNKTIHMDQTLLIGIAQRGFFFCNTSPNTSSLWNCLDSVPCWSFQSKLWHSVAIMQCNMRLASGMPGQIFRPEPNGIRLKWCPPKSISLSKNRSGSNRSGLFHMAGSLEIAQALIIFLHVWELHIHLSWFHLWLHGELTGVQLGDSGALLWQ